MPRCTYEHACVSMLAPKSGWLLTMVLIKFRTWSSGTYMVEELHQYRLTCYEIWLSRSASIHLWTWDRSQSLSWSWLVFEYNKWAIIKKLRRLRGKICKSKKVRASNPATWYNGCNGKEGHSTRFDFDNCLTINHYKIYDDTSSSSILESGNLLTTVLWVVHHHHYK